MTNKIEYLFKIKQTQDINNYPTKKELIYKDENGNWENMEIWFKNEQHATDWCRWFFNIEKKELQRLSIFSNNISTPSWDYTLF